MKRLVQAVLLALCLVLAMAGGVASAQTKPEFKLGFKALADQIPDVVGEPLENEHWGANGDSLQLSSNGLMVWRKADNWTAFTDGARTWINGPFGVQSRINSERFTWEGATVANTTSGTESTVSASPQPPRSGEAVKLVVDYPTLGATVLDEFTVRGWAVDPTARTSPWSGIDDFRVYVDGTMEGGGRRVVFSMGSLYARVWVLGDPTASKMDYAIVLADRMIRRFERLPVPAGPAFQLLPPG